MAVAELCPLPLQSAFHRLDEKAGGCTEPACRELTQRRHGAQPAAGTLSHQPHQQRDMLHRCSFLHIKIIRTLFYFLLPSFLKRNYLTSRSSNQAAPWPLGLSLCPQMAPEHCGGCTFVHMDALMCTSYRPCPAHLCAPPCPEKPGFMPDATSRQGGGGTPVFPRAPPPSCSHPAQSSSFSAASSAALQQ